MFFTYYQRTTLMEEGILGVCGPLATRSPTIGAFKRHLNFHVSHRGNLWNQTDSVLDICVFLDYSWVTEPNGPSELNMRSTSSHRYDEPGNSNVSSSSDMSNTNHNSLSLGSNTSRPTITVLRDLFSNALHPCSFSTNTCTFSRSRHPPGQPVPSLNLNEHSELDDTSPLPLLRRLIMHSFRTVIRPNPSIISSNVISYTRCHRNYYSTYWDSSTSQKPLLVQARSASVGSPLYEMRVCGRDVSLTWIQWWLGFGRRDGGVAMQESIKDGTGWGGEYSKHHR